MNPNAEEALKKWREENKGKPKAAPKNPREKAEANPASLRFAINAMCFYCMGDGHDSGYVQSIRECSAPTCPLWPHRPYQRNEND